MAKEVFSRYDTADYLKTEEDITAFVEAIMEEGGDDLAYIAHALGAVAWATSSE
jgi:probable addiction module antidote protein